MTNAEQAWEAWSPRLTDLSKEAPSYHEAFEAGWNAVIEACGGTDHILRVGEMDWTLQHPLHERLDGSLFDCKFQPLVKHLAWKERFPVGYVRVWEDRGAILWEEVDAR